MRASNFLVALCLLFTSAFLNLSATDIGGTITSDVTLDITGSPYTLTSDYLVPDGFTLTIEPGVDIIINSYTRDIIVEGSLIAEGTTSEHISIYSESGNGGGSLVLRTSSNSHSIIFCDFENLGIIGASGFDTAIRIEDAQLSMDYCTFTNCGNDGEEHLIAFPSSIGNIGTNNQLTIVKLLSDTIASDSSWPKIAPSGFAYRLAGDLVVDDGATLTIDAGNKVEIPSYTTNIIINGAINATGMPSDSIHFFSTSGNGGGSIVLRTSTNSHSFMYCSFEKLGRIGASAFDCAIRNEDTNLQMDFCRFTNCGFNGVEHIISYPFALDNIGANNDIERVKLLSDTIERNCIWPKIDPSGIIYQMKGDIVVLEGNQLELEGGITVDIPQYTRDLKIEGSIVAIGSPSDSIYFSSDDINGGGSLALQPGSNAILEYVRFRDLGRIGATAYDAGIYLTEADLSMDHCSFTNCGTDGTRHMKAHASSLSDIGPNNSIEKVYLFPNSLTSSCTWPKVDPSGVIIEIPGDITLLSGDELTIEPGVQIDFKVYPADLFIEGTLIALGSNSDSISFFSLDLNGGGSLVLRDGSNAQLAYLNFENLGRISATAFDAGLYIQSASVVADHLSFENCGSGGNRHITANQDVLSNFGSNNSIADILILEVEDDVDATWPLLTPIGSRYVISSDLWIDEEATLEIEAGNDVIIDNYVNNVTIDGTLRAVGTASDSIRFLGPGGNGGGSIIFSTSSTSNELRYISTNRLGLISSSAYDAALRIETSELILAKSTLRNSRFGIDIISGQPTIENNIIKDNSQYGLRNAESNSTVTACDNYWGDPTGPFNPTSNPDGLGDRVSDNVIAIDCDADALEVVCPSDTTLYIGDVYTQQAIGIVEVCIRDCEASSSSYLDEISEPQCSGDMFRLWTVTDICGNEKQCAQTISWIDSIAPSIVCPPSETLECNMAPPSIDLNEVIASDNCSSDILKSFEGEETYVLGCLHQFDRTFKVTDAAGNSRTCITSYFVEVDTEAPIIQGVPDDIEVNCDEIPGIPMLIAFDVCGNPIPDFSQEITGECPGTIIRTWTATDGCGNSAVEMQVIDVVESCPEDINGDGTVNITDFIQFNSAFGTSCDGCPEDINQDGLVNITDFIQFNSAFGTDCPGMMAPAASFGMVPRSATLHEALAAMEFSSLNPDLEKYLLEDDTSISLDLFPVPNDGKQLGMHLEGLSSDAIQLMTYQIYDLTGKVVSQGNLQFARDNSVQIDFNVVLEPSAYTLQLIVDGQVLSKRFLVE